MKLIGSFFFKFEIDLGWLLEAKSPSWVLLFYDLCIKAGMLAAEYIAEAAEALFEIKLVCLLLFLIFIMDECEREFLEGWLKMS